MLQVWFAERPIAQYKTAAFVSIAWVLEAHSTEHFLLFFVIQNPGELYTPRALKLTLTPGLINSASDLPVSGFFLLKIWPRVGVFCNRKLPTKATAAPQ
jgi:hypothetical protein